jgi:signal transduction histidine kinase
MHQQSDNSNEINRPAIDGLVQEYKDRIARNTSRIFAVLMLLQWAGAILVALFVSPLTWIGTQSSVHLHVWAAIFLGGIITVFPVALALACPTKTLTRHIIAAGQMLMSALLIHITGGRVETHFHVFGSLAILAFFRDWRVLVTATFVVYLDHLVRGLYWPQSVYGVLYASPWRAVEHAWWVGFEVLFLTIAIYQSVREMKIMAERQVTLQSFNNRVESEVRVRTAELRAANQHMETFCYSMSHDLKAPLRGIHSFSDLLIQDDEQQLNERGRNYVLRIRDSASKMNLLLSDLLEYSRVSTANLAIDPVDLSEVAEEAVRLLSVGIQEGMATVNIEPNLGMVLGNRATLVQVMLNLLSNAINYGKLGTPLQIDVTSESRGNIIRLSVRDNGIGIAPRYHQKIFDIFERIPNDSKHLGTGIGLAIVAKSIERLGGHLGVESAPGTGSDFWFELPAVASLPKQTLPESIPVLALDA